MNNHWLLWISGVLFCCTGIYLFLKNVYEEGRSIRWAVIMMIMGVVLLTAGTAKYLKLTD